MKKTAYSLMACFLANFATCVQAQTHVISEGHTDLSVNYAGGAWDLHVGYDPTGEEFPASDVLLRVNPGAQTTVPNDPAFSFLGSPGSAVWLLPQTQNPNLLFLGYGA